MQHDYNICNLYIRNAILLNCSCFVVCCELLRYRFDLFDIVCAACATLFFRFKCSFAFIFEEGEADGIWVSRFTSDSNNTRIFIHMLFVVT